jgi:hypothetical protein
MKKEEAHRLAMAQQHQEEDHSAKDGTAPARNKRRKRNSCACVIERGTFSTPNFIHASLMQPFATSAIIWQVDI